MKAEGVLNFGEKNMTGDMYSLESRETILKNMLENIEICYSFIKNKLEDLFGEIDEDAENIRKFVLKSNEDMVWFLCSKYLQAEQYLKDFDFDRKCKYIGSEKQEYYCKKIKNNRIEMQNAFIDSLKFMLEKDDMLKSKDELLDILFKKIEQYQEDVEND